MSYNMYSPGTAAIMQSLLGRRLPINPMSYDAEREADLSLGYGRNLLRGTGNPRGTMSGAVRDAGEKLIGAFLAGKSGQKYNDLEDRANSQWAEIMKAEGGLQGMQDVASGYGASLDPKVAQQIAIMKQYDALDAPNRDFQREQWEWQKQQADRQYALQERSLNAQLARSAGGGSWQLTSLPDQYGGARPVLFNPRTGQVVPYEGLGGDTAGDMSGSDAHYGAPPMQSPDNSVVAPGMPGINTEIDAAKLSLQPNLPQNIAGGSELPESQALLQEQQTSQFPNESLQQVPAQTPQEPRPFAPGTVVDGSGQPVRVPANVPWGKQERQYVGGKEYYGQRTPNGAFFKIGGEVPQSLAERKLEKDMLKAEKADEAKQDVNIKIADAALRSADESLNLLDKSLAAGSQAKAWLGDEHSLFRKMGLGQNMDNLIRALQPMQTATMLEMIGNMKNQSASGALNMRITQLEAVMLSGILGSLEIDQDPVQLRKNILAHKMAYEEMRNLAKDIQREKGYAQRDAPDYASGSQEWEDVQ